MDAFTSSQDGHGGSRPSLKYKKQIHFLKGEWHTSLWHTKMYASSCWIHPSLILKRVIMSSWSSRVTTASLPAPLTFFLPLSSFVAHIWPRIFSFNSIPNAFQRASHRTTDRVNPEMNASANRRFLSRSQQRVCESVTFELAFSHSRRQVDAPFLPHVSFVPRSAFLLPQALRELVSPSNWAAAAAAAPASAMASC